MREDDERKRRRRRGCRRDEEMHGIHERRMDRQGGREVWQKVVRRSYTHSLVRSYSRSSYSPSSRSIRFLPSFTAASCGCLLQHSFARNVPYSNPGSYEIISGLNTLYIYIHISRSLDLDRFGCFFDRKLIPRSLARLLLRSHKRARPRIEWLVMGVNYA